MLNAIHIISSDKISVHESGIFWIVNACEWKVKYLHYFKTDFHYVATDWPETCVDQAVPQLTEICLLLPPECYD